MKKKVLIITPYIPYPLNNGGNYAQYSVIDKLRNCLEIHLLFIIRSNHDKKNVSALKEQWPNVIFHEYIYDKYSEIRLIGKIYDIIIFIIICFVTLLHKKFKALIKNFYLIKNLTYKHYYNNKLIELIKSIISNESIEFVQVEFYDFLGLIEFLPTQITKIFVLHEIAFIRNIRWINIHFKNLKIIEYYFNRKKKYEIEMLSKYDKVAVFSSVDKNIILEYIPSLPVLISPFPFSDEKNNTHIKFKFSNNIVFLGSEYHYPNLDGFDWFVSEIWKPICDLLPDVRLKVIGQWKEQTINLYSNDEKILFKGFVDDLAKEVNNSIFIVPIRIGSGIRVKILDAINIGVPIVTTSVGAEGLEFTGNHDFLIGDTVISFIENIKVLTEDNIMCQKLIANSRKTLSEKYSSDIVLPKRIKLYN